MWTDCVLCPYEDEHVCITKAEYLGAKNDGTCDHCIQCLYYAHELKDAGIGIADYDTADEQTSEPALYLLKLKKIEVYDADGVTLELHEPSSAGKTIDLASQLRSIIVRQASGLARDPERTKRAANNVYRNPTLQVKRAFALRVSSMAEQVESRAIVWLLRRTTVLDTESCSRFTTPKKTVKIFEVAVGRYTSSQFATELY